ncbi:MAG: hypothetical protein QOK49_2941, partial [Baekduia sp.]|nr:hypothetical protein [Baekduia sp.]
MSSPGRPLTVTRVTLPAALPSADAYPSERVVDVVLRTGHTLRIRPVRTDDASGLARFLDGLSVEARAFRFFSAGTDLHAAACAAADVDYRDRYGIVAVSGDDGSVLAHGMYIREGTGPAEVAFAVGDELHGQGIATTMLAHLAEAATANGIDRFVADVLPGNHRMVEVFRESGLDARVRAEPGLLVVSMPTELSAGAQARYDERDAAAAAAAVEAVLRPRAIAVVGASEREGSVGGAVLSNVLAAGYTGSVHAVHPHALSVHGVKAHPRVTDVDGPVDLAVIATPASAVAGAAHDCVAKGVRALVVISAGFAEAGPAGAARQRELLEICRAGGMRLVGPNCLGVLNTDPAVRLNAT